MTGAIATLEPLQSLTLTENRKVFTILHTNDMHSNLLGVGPVSDYSPMVLENDRTRGGYARLAALIAQRRQEMSRFGPVLTLDAGDSTMGTAAAAATRELGSELQLMARMGYDATTFGNHEFNYGPDGLGKAIAKAANAGFVPTILATNTRLDAQEPRLAELQRLAKAEVIRPYKVIDRGGIRFGIIGLIGYDASKYAIDPGGVKFDDPKETAKRLVDTLRNKEKVDVVIALQHGGMNENDDGTFTTGEDVELLKAVPGIDLVVGGHTHTYLKKAVLVDGRPVVQTGKYGEYLGELVIGVESGKPQLVSYRLIPVEDNIKGDSLIQKEVERFLDRASAVIFAPRGYKVTQPLVVISEDWTNDYNNIEAGTPLANVVTDAVRKATNADIGFTANGLIRAGLTKGRSGVQTVYDIFAISPLGGGIVDTTAGSALVQTYFTGKELKTILEFFLVDDPHHPGEFFPRVSGMRFRYNPARPKFDVVTAIELGDIEKGYRPIDISANGTKLYSFACNLFAGVIIAVIPKYTKGKLQLVPKKQDGSAIATVKKALISPLRERYLINVAGGEDLVAQGNVLDHEYTIHRNHNQVAEVSKRWFRIRDTYGVEVEPGEDDILILESTAVIDVLANPEERLH